MTVVGDGIISLEKLVKKVSDGYPTGNVWNYFYRLETDLDDPIPELIVDTLMEGSRESLQDIEHTANELFELADLLSSAADTLSMFVAEYEKKDEYEPGRDPDPEPEPVQEIRAVREPGWEDAGTRS